MYHRVHVHYKVVQKKAQSLMHRYFVTSCNRITRHGQPGH